jgi:hypothetical protein
MVELQWSESVLSMREYERSKVNKIQTQTNNGNNAKLSVYFSRYT